jgi:exodeoxyribonuclease VII large subunit
MTRQAASSDNTFTVTDVNLMAKELLETALPPLWIEGEVSNLSMHGSGHWYLSLKDEQSQLRAAMFRNRNQSVRIKPRNGMHVRVQGRISLYAPRGDYQFIIDRMEEAGIGALQRAFEVLKAKLQAEGLFDPAVKHPLPFPPRRIGLVTSPTGAAVHDILSVLARRCPLIPVVIYPAAVQGSDAPQQLIDALATANQRAECDVLIVGRGGGSLEDLWAFNDERLARTLRASAIPVISAVGHEVDFTIADFVADARAPTPSAAAEMVSPQSEEWQQGLLRAERSLTQRMQRLLRDANAQLSGLNARLKHPGRRLEEHHQRLDELNTRLHQATERLFSLRHLRLDKLAARLDTHSPSRRIALLKERVTRQDAALQNLMKAQLIRARHDLLAAANTLNALSPLSTLDRGYGIIRDQQGNILRSSTDTRPGAIVVASLARGGLECRVENILPPAADPD